MKKVVSLIAVVALVLTMIPAVSFAQGIDYDSLTRQELEQIISEAEAAISRNHSVSSTVESLVQSKIKLDIIRMMTEWTSEPEWRWFDWTYTRSWAEVTVQSDAKYNREYYPFVGTYLEKNGDYTLIYLKVGEKVLLDERDKVQEGASQQAGSGYAADDMTGKTQQATTDQGPTAEPTPEPTPEPEVIVAQRGDKNETVRAIQTMLIRFGFLNGSADGSFGPGTEGSVKAFQSYYGLDETGIVTESVYELMVAEYEALPEEVHYDRISAYKFDDIYSDNEVAADLAYKGKIVEISGRVESVSSTWGTYFVRLATDEWGIGTISFSFSKAHAQEVAAVKKGDSVVIRGKCDGKGLFEISFSDCEFVD